jgi:hypothetical protein
MAKGKVTRITIEKGPKSLCGDYKDFDCNNMLTGFATFRVYAVEAAEIRLARELGCLQLLDPRMIHAV